MSDPAEAEGQEPNAETPAPEANQPIAPEAKSTSTPEGQPTGPEPKTFDEDYVKQLRKEAAENRKRANEAEARNKAFEEEKLSEQEKAQKRAEEAEQRAVAADAKLRQANLLVALSKNDDLADAQAAAKLIEGIEYDDDGQPTNLEDRVKAALESYPVLKKGRTVDAADPANPESRKRTPETPAQALQRIHSGGGADPFEGASIFIGPRSNVEPE